MLFHSVDFLALLVLVFALYVLLTRAAQNVLLLVASYAFYSAWDWRFTVLLVGSSVVNYFFAPAILRSVRHSRALVGIAIGLNLLPLAYFKYAGFVSESSLAIANAMGFSPDIDVLETINPVGISFFTFQAISYVVDVYRRQTTAHYGSWRALTDLALYIAFFPQLIAGPIERSTQLLPQLLERRHLGFEAIQNGIWLFLLGLTLKTGIADAISSEVDRVFSTLDGRTLLDLYYGTIGFAIQIFCDFAGYTLMARGIARILGFSLVINSRQPYLAASFSDFWRRWHVSLSQWVRDYIYIPLGGSRRGNARTYFNLLFVMTVMGLWHGAGWTFVAWGLLHGIFLALERMATVPLTRLRRRRLGALVYGLVVFHGVLVGWYLFRADSIADAAAGLGSALASPLSSVSADMDFDLPTLAPYLMFLGYFLIHELPAWRADQEIILGSCRLGHRLVLLTFIAFAVLASGGSNDSPFIYFQF